MGMGEVGEAEVRPDRLGDVGHHVALLVPGSEDADLGFALWIDGSVQESDPGVTAAGVGEHEKGGVGPAPGMVVPMNVEAFPGVLALVRREAGGRRDLGRAEPVVPDHVLQPGAQVLIVLRRAGIDGIAGIGRGGGLGSQAGRPENGKQERFHVAVQSWTGSCSSRRRWPRSTVVGTRWPAFLFLRT